VTTTTPHAADGEPLNEHTHAGVADPNLHHHTPEQIKKEMRVYILVFISLAVLTGVTVGVCYGLDLPIHYAIMVAMAVALIKGALVACFFMHLISERKLIYGVLIMTVIFFIALIALPVSHMLDRLHY
jgi:cytochrome c oxidase subunit 4